MADAISPVYKKRDSQPQGIEHKLLAPE